MALISLIKRFCMSTGALQIVVLDKLDYCASLNNLKEVMDKPNFSFVRGDIQAADLVSYVLKESSIDTVMHFAAQTHVDNSFGNSLAFTMNNTYGTHTLLEACRVYGKIKRFINVSTDEVRSIFSCHAHLLLPALSSTSITLAYTVHAARCEIPLRYTAKHHFTRIKVWTRQRCWSLQTRILRQRPEPR
jgi:nucleoside-diphosphate-sugar epimerase